MTATARDLRVKAGSLLDRVRRGQRVTITYRGRPIAALVPLDASRHQTLDPVGFGMWRQRKDMRSVDRWLRYARAPRHRA